MENNENEKLIPDQQVGRKLDTDNQIIAPTQEEAQLLFQKAVDRLMDVNRWDKICGPVSATFKLTDAEGKEISRLPQMGDHFKIDIPGPGPAAGEGFDWVRIEALEDRRNPSAEEESVTMRVRPSTSPENSLTDTAHFFDEKATSSFRVIRERNVVRAEVHGRNEVPNTHVEKTTDKVRNAVVGTGAVSGMSNPQWNSLVKGLLDQHIKD